MTPAAPRWVAFLRNVNLGQPPSPTRGQLEAAFTRAGAGGAASFLNNGTVVYTASSQPAARRIAREAGAVLLGECGLREPIFVQALSTLVDLAASEPFAGLEDPLITEHAISFFEPRAGAGVRVPLISARGDCLVFRLGAGWALSGMRTVRGKTGYPTPLLEQALGAPATTRSWRTLLRLVKRPAAQP